MYRARNIIGLIIVFWILILNQVVAQNNPGNDFSLKDYTKHQYEIKMRDGIKLHTVVYRPKDSTQEYPILMVRTPYGTGPYKKGEMPGKLSDNPFLVQDGYIFVFQDVRGRWMSEGHFSTVSPNEPGPGGIDESSDTYETIAWLLKNVPFNNGKVGIYGCSYPGFFTTAALPNAHPALAAASPQAPAVNWFFGTFHHNGSFSLNLWPMISVFGLQRKGPTDTIWHSKPHVDIATPYQFYLHNVEPLTKSDKYYKDNKLWQQLVQHPNYDTFWQKRNMLPNLKDLHLPVLTVGGWFDLVTIYGALNTYKSIRRQNPNIENTLVMGPWFHCQWGGMGASSYVGDIYFGDSSVNYFFKKQIEAPFFKKHLKGDKNIHLPEAWMFNTGLNKWQRFDWWPPKNAEKENWYVHADGSLSHQEPMKKKKKYSQYYSDPAHPVPDMEPPKFGFQWGIYSTSNQQFATRRPDVLTFQTQELQENVTISGPITATLYVSTTGTASDWIVKVIDVYPPDIERHPRSDRDKAVVKHKPDGVDLNNYHQLLRTGIMRGRFRNSYSNPEPFTPNKITKVTVQLLDIYHTFQAGHRIEIQIQSTDFPFIDINPQTFVKNIYLADSSYFKPAIQRVFHTQEYPSSIEMYVNK